MKQTKNIKRYILIFSLVTIFLISIFAYLSTVNKYEVYYIYLKHISIPIIKWSEKYFIDNFDTIVTPYCRGNITTWNKSININRNSQNEYTLVKNTITNDLMDRINVDGKVDDDVLRELVRRVTKYVHLDGKVVNPDDMYIFDVLNTAGNYFPFFHTDIEWNTFCECNGFQVWILLKKDEEIYPRGNMFIMESDQVEPGTYIHIEEDEVTKIINTTNYINDNTLKKYKSLDDLNPKIHYLHCDIGDVFIMNPSVYHCSDVFVQNSTRKAINFRLLHKPNKTNTVPFCNSKRMYSSIVKSNTNVICKQDSCKIEVNRNNDFFY